MLKESKETRIKKYEECYNYLKKEIDFEDARYIYIESKASTQFNILIFILGLVAIGANEYFNIIKSINSIYFICFV